MMYMQAGRRQLQLPAMASHGPPPRATRSGLLLVLLAVIAAACKPVAATGRPPLSSGRKMLLVGGQEARSDGRYPYMARITFALDDKTGLQAGCGGTLVSRSVVLTAAHCAVLAKPPSHPTNVYVRLGAFDTLTDQATREGEYLLRRAKRVEVHPDYVQRAEDRVVSPNDLALLLLDEAAPSSWPTVQLPPSNASYPRDDTKLHALGWGALDSDATQPAYTLQDLELPAVSRETCAKQWGYAGAAASTISKGHICAGLQSHRNICFGDSGGPLLLRGGRAEQDVQVGVTSFSFPTCALPGMPGVFTFLPLYRDWIDKQLRQLDPEGLAKPPPAPKPRPPPAAKSSKPSSPPPKPAKAAAAPPSPRPAGKDRRAAAAALRAPSPAVDAAAPEQAVLPQPAPAAADGLAAAPAPAPLPAAAVAGEEQSLAEGAAGAPAPAAAPAAEQAAAPALSLR